MDSDATSDAGETLLPPTAASVLGTKGALRIRPHGSHQKAHVVLRRMEVSREGEGAKPVVYFSLFAAKRIEVKQGKEILLAVAGPDGKHKDTALVFEGDLDVPEESDEEEEEELPIINPEAMPPKLRKAWARQNYDLENGVSGHVSVGVQAQGEYASAAVQVQPSAAEVAIQVQPSVVSASVQAQPDLTTASVQVSIDPVVPREKSPVVLNGTLASEKEPSPAKNEEAGGGVESDRQRSLSPMELDSPSNIKSDKGLPHRSPPSSIASSPRSDSSMIEEKRAPKHRLPIPSRWYLDNPSPQDTYASSSTFPPPHPRTSLSGNRARTSPVAQRSSQSDVLASAPDNKVGTPSVKSQVPESPASRPQSYTSAPPSGPRALQSLGGGAKPTAPQPPPRTIPSSGNGPSSQVSLPLPSDSTVKQTQAPATGPKQEEKPTRATHPPPTAPAAQPAKQMQNTSTAPPPPPDVAPPPLPKTEDRPTSAASTNSRMGRKPPPNFVRAGWTPPTAAAAPQPSTIDNPLGIRPSVSPATTLAPRKSSTPVGPSTAQPASAKKPKTIVVGSAWPSGRAYSTAPTSSSGPTVSASSSYSSINGDGASSIPSASTSATSVMSDAGSGRSQSMAPKSKDLSNMVSYHSPSPPLLGQLLPLSYPPPPPETQPPPVPPALPALRPLYPIANEPAEGSRLTLNTQFNGASQTVGPNTAPQTPASATSNGSFSYPTGGKSINDGTNGHATTRGGPAFIHPLPPKPVARTGPAPHKYEPSRPVIGVKRSASIVVRGEDESASSRKRFLKWPMADFIHRIRIKSETNPGVKGIVFNSTGSQFAVHCFDCTIRIWNNRTKTEVAKLTHASNVVSVAWMDDDAGVVTLGENGSVSKWTRLGQNKWHWAKILESGQHNEEPTCLAYMRDRIAVAYPRSGVRVWLWVKGTWQPQRSILRQNVTTIKFIEDGNALLGGTTDAVLWYCQVPNGTLRAFSFVKSKVHSIDVNAQGTHALVAQAGGRAHLVDIRQSTGSKDNNKIQQVYVAKDADVQVNAEYEFGAVFASGQTVLFGDYQGCILVWDKNKGEIVSGLDHGEDPKATIQAIANFDSNSSAADTHLITGTKEGELIWWWPPGAPVPSSEDVTSHKRMRIKREEP